MLKNSASLNWIHDTDDGPDGTKQKVMQQHLWLMTISSSLNFGSYIKFHLQIAVELLLKCPTRFIFLQVFANIYIILLNIFNI